MELSTTIWFIFYFKFIVLQTKLLNQFPATLNHCVSIYKF